MTMTSVHDPLILARARALLEGVTFGAFRQLVARRGWTAASVAALLAARQATFGGPRSSPFYESPTAYLHRLLRRGHASDDARVIPYRCLLTLYVESIDREDVRRLGEISCRCGCGRALVGRRLYATGACRMRALRQRQVSGVRDCPNRPPETQQPQGVFRHISGDPVSHPSCDTLVAQIGSWAVEADSRAHAGACLTGQAGAPAPGTEG
jgi:hypothetical protein